MEMQVGHISTRRNRTALPGIRGQIIYVPDVEPISWGDAQNRRLSSSIKGKGVPAVWANYRMQRERKRVVSCSKLWSRLWLLLALEAKSRKNGEHCHDSGSDCVSTQFFVG
jgi:hypothetical protein